MLDLSSDLFDHMCDYPCKKPQTLTDCSALKQAPCTARCDVFKGTPTASTSPHILKAKSLHPHTTSQQAELTVLPWTLTPASNLTVNTHTDFKFTYNVRHSSTLLWRERSFLTQMGTSIINSFLTQKDLEAALIAKQPFPTARDIKKTND